MGKTIPSKNALDFFELKIPTINRKGKFGIVNI